MAEQPEQPQSTVSAALCISPEAVDRFGKVLRHLVVGLVDQAVSLRLLSSDPRVEPLRLGPVQTLVHQPIAWPLRRRRLLQLIDVLTHQPPRIVHALSRESYFVAAELAKALETDLVFHVSSLADCEAIAETDRTQVGSFISIGERLRQTLTDQLKVPPDRVCLIHPGVSVAPSIMCFANPGREATILCMSEFERYSGVDIFVEALALLRRRGQSPLAFLLGEGRYESSLRSLVRDRGLLATVTFAHPLGDMGSVIRNADIFVRPSADQAFVSDTLHAMGMGALVITFASNVLDYLQDGQTAMICRNKTADSLADALAIALSNKDEARRIAGGGLEFVRAHHGISVMAERTAAVYRQLVLFGATFAINRS